MIHPVEYCFFITFWKKNLLNKNTVEKLNITSLSGNRSFILNPFFINWGYSEGGVEKKVQKEQKGTSNPKLDIVQMRWVGCQLIFRR